MNENPRPKATQGIDLTIQQRYPAQNFLDGNRPYFDEIARLFGEDGGTPAENSMTSNIQQEQNLFRDGKDT